MGPSDLYLDIVMVGQGRLGKRIAFEVGRLTTKQIVHKKISLARIDPLSGLFLNDRVKTVDKGHLLINHLIICIAPKAASSMLKMAKNHWSWSNILNGVLNQVKARQLTIKQLIFVSSTRVYDGIEKGRINASITARSNSERGRALIVAEQTIELLTERFHILRCSGLYGEEYSKYGAVLAKQSDQLRFGVASERVASTVAELIDSSVASSYSLLTDGFAYYRGERITVAQACQLAGDRRILINSQSSKSDMAE